MNSVLGGLSLVVVLDVVDGVLAAGVDLLASCRVHRVSFIQLVAFVLICRCGDAALGYGYLCRIVKHPCSAIDLKLICFLLNSVDGVVNSVLGGLSLVVVLDVGQGDDSAALYLSGAVGNTDARKLVAGVGVLGKATVNDGYHRRVVVDPCGAFVGLGVGSLLNTVDNVLDCVLGGLGLAVVLDVVVDNCVTVIHGFGQLFNCFAVDGDIVQLPAGEGLGGYALGTQGVRLKNLNSRSKVDVRIGLNLTAQLVVNSGAEGLLLAVVYFGCDSNNHIAGDGCIIIGICLGVGDLLLHAVDGYGANLIALCGFEAQLRAFAMVDFKRIAARTLVDRAVINRAGHGIDIAGVGDGDHRILIAHCGRLAVDGRAIAGNGIGEAGNIRYIECVGFAVLKVFPGVSSRQPRSIRIRFVIHIIDSKRVAMCYLQVAVKMPLSTGDTVITIRTISAMQTKFCCFFAALVVFDRIVCAGPNNIVQIKVLIGGALMQLKRAIVHILCHSGSCFPILEIGGVNRCAEQACGDINITDSIPAAGVQATVVYILSVSVEAYVHIHSGGLGRGSSFLNGDCPSLGIAHCIFAGNSSLSGCNASYLSRGTIPDHGCNGFVSTFPGVKPPVVIAIKVYVFAYLNSSSFIRQRYRIQAKGVLTKGVLNGVLGGGLLLGGLLFNGGERHICNNYIDIRLGRAGESHAILSYQNIGALAIDGDNALLAKSVGRVHRAELHLGRAVSPHRREGNRPLKRRALGHRERIRLGKGSTVLRDKVNLKIDRILAALRGLLTGRGHRLLQALSQRAGREQRENHGQAQQHAEQTTKHTFVFHFFPPTIKYIS